MSNQSQFLTDDFYLAVDGGGTSCKTRLYNAAGDVLGQGLAGASNARLGAERVMKEIMTSAKQAFDDAGVDFAHLNRTHACFGLAGLELKRDQDNFYALEHSFKSVTLETDAVTACIGAFAGAEGAIVITGTGSSAVAIHQQTIHNIGGWGFEISDSGSGAAVGRHAVRYALRAAEGLEPSSPLTQYIMDFFNNDMGDIVLWAERAEPKDFAIFCAKAFDLYEVGDAAAIMLVERHMRELTQLIDGIMAFGSEQFTLLGGLADRSAALLPAHLKAQYVECQNDALYGCFLRITKHLNGSRVQVPQKLQNNTSVLVQKASSHV
ncbi:MAG: N-acetylglucosamine kinase [Alphaproteobacteria bacterium]|nr:N-acetylglucosamine kinase [Alphaproteobacteria bacterium]